MLFLGIFMINQSLLPAENMYKLYNIKNRVLCQKSETDTLERCVKRFERRSFFISNFEHSFTVFVNKLE